MNGNRNLKLILLVAVLVVGTASIAGAQGPRGRRGPGGPGFGPGPGGPGPFISSKGAAFQANYTSKRVENVVINGAASSITTTSTGTIARDGSGDTYVSDTHPAGGPQGSSSGGTVETAIIRNVTAMKNYILNITKQTYEEFSIRARGNGGKPPFNGRGPNPGANNRANNRPTPTAVNWTDSVSGYMCGAEETKISHTIQPAAGSGNPAITVTDDRIFCPALSIEVQNTHTDPRFGSTSYVVSGITGTPSVSFTPPANFTLAKRRGFGRGGAGGSGTGSGSTGGSGGTL